MKAPLINTGAELSPCRNYRYALWRIWDPAAPTVLFIGLNPSTADEKSDDPTLRRCIRFARSWGYGGVYTANLFAYRATDPQKMKTAKDPVGAENDRWLLDLAHRSELRIAAWGNDGVFQQRAEQVIAFLPQLHCLKRNRSGQPAHPLYQKASTQPILFNC